MATTTTTIELTDIETSPRLTPNDPYQLSSALKSPAEIESLAAGAGTHTRLPFSTRLRRSSTGEKRDIKGLQSFYESQNAHIERMLKSVDEHRREAKDAAVDNRLRFLIAVHGSLAANVILAVLQLYAAISSGSLSLFASMFRSFCLRCGGKHYG
jgi:hypothetical protein